jgi:hypothetical protein
MLQTALQTLHLHSFQISRKINFNFLLQISIYSFLHDTYEHITSHFWHRFDTNNAAVMKSQPGQVKHKGFQYDAI